MKTLIFRCPTPQDIEINLDGRVLTTSTSAILDMLDRAQRDGEAKMVSFSKDELASDGQSLAG